MRDPSPQVWTNIEQSLHREGMLAEGRTSRQGHIKNYSISQTQSWTPLGWTMGLATTALFAAALMNYQPHFPGATSAQDNQAAVAPYVYEDQDQQLVTQVSRADPSLGRAYDRGLKEADQYIGDARRAVDRDPQDVMAREQLFEAYRQKQMLYQMGTGRTLP